MPEDDGVAVVRPPISVSIAVAVTWVEVVGVLAFTLWFAVGVFPVEDPVAERLAVAGGVVVFLLAVVAGLVAAAKSLRLLRHWPRSLLIVLQIIALALGLPFARDGVLIGWLMTIAAAVSIGALLAPGTTAAIEG